MTSQSAIVPAAKMILADLLSRKPCMGDRTEQEEIDNFGCNAISIGYNTVALNHDVDIQLAKLQNSAAECAEYQHLIKSFNMYKDRNDMRRRARRMT